MSKKILCLLLSFVFLFTFVTPVSAAETEEKSAYDLEVYMDLSSNGLIEFDAEQAIADGFPVEMVTSHQERIDIMNDLVLDGVTTISEDYTAIVYFDGARSSTYNLDQSYVEYNPWGYTIYYSRTDTEDLVNALPSNSTLITLAKIVKRKSFTASLATYGLVLYISSIRAAASNGTGIYVQVYNDGTTATPLCAVGPR